ncbi:MAG: branched-chain amino acid ABC transporter permease [Bacilli bacterium]
MPPKFKHHFKIKNWLLKTMKHPFFGIIVLGMILLFIFPLSGYTLRGAIGQSLTFTIVALGFSILLGFSGLASLGTAGFAGVGAYSLGLLTNDLGFPFIVSLIVTLLFAIIIGVIVGFVSLRIEGMYLAIITLGLSSILNQVFISMFGDGTYVLSRFELFGMPINVPMTGMLIVLILVIMMMAVSNVSKSPTGRAMIAMKNSESAAQAMGISVLKYRLLAFIIATVLAALGGMLYMAFERNMSPSTSSQPGVFNLAYSLNILAAVVIGGSRSIFGIFFASLFVYRFDVIVNALFRGVEINGNWILILSGVIIILMIMFYPGGFSRLALDAKFKFKKFFAKQKLKWKEYRYGKDPK